ncbi:MAG TPA: MFS transporter [Streptosporangiaceae bacterium]|nr:MFS transporter [Streptosporangiaceae bacterium]
MWMGDALRRMADAADATGGAVKSGARAGATATRKTGGFVHRLTGASGAGRTGLGTLIELTAASGAADMFVTVALAGTVFFSTSVDQARGKVVVFLLVTMAPFALLAPFIGPALDRMQQGRRYVLAGTLMARGLLCWGMSAAVGNTLTLLPAAFGILVLQKAYGVVKASVTPRLLPAEIPLVTANSRSGLFALAGSTVAAGVAAGIEELFGAAWVLRVGTIVYLAAMLLALRLPDQIDVPVVVVAPPPPVTVPGPPPGPPRATEPLGQPALPPGTGPGEAAPGVAAPGRGRWRGLANVGPVVGEAMAVNAVLRAFSGYVLFMLAFLLRSLDFGAKSHYALVHGHMQLVHTSGVSTSFKLGALAFGLSAGSLISMAAGSLLKARAPQLMMFGVLAIAPVVAAASAYFFGLWAAVAVEFAAIFCASLAKLSQDSIVQREIGEEIRSSTFSVSETLNQVANVAGGVAGVLVSMLNNGQAGLGIAAAFLAVAFFLLISRRRRRVLSVRQVQAAPRAA